jgi:HAD superfamily hydrolase (TIGR01549 family)
MFALNDIEKIKRKVEEYEYVSFDIFDTLIKRKVKEPSDIFFIVEQEYNKKSDDKIENFKHDRIKAYEKARANGTFEEVTLEEIYNNLDKYSDKQREELMKLEKKIESDMCIQNENIFSIYQQCIEHKKKIFITSDMYLPVENIKCILRDAGYTTYEKLYLSSEERKTKKSGKLFEKLLNDNDISKKSIIHIGDSPLNDFISPKKLGIAAILIKR